MYGQERRGRDDGEQASGGETFEGWGLQPLIRGVTEGPCPPSPPGITPYPLAGNPPCKCLPLPPNAPALSLHALCFLRLLLHPSCLPESSTKHTVGFKATGERGSSTQAPATSPQLLEFPVTESAGSQAWPRGPYPKSHLNMAQLVDQKRHVTQFGGSQIPTNSL